MSVITMLATATGESIFWLLLGVLFFAAIALFCCALSGYIDAWRDSADDPPEAPRAPDKSLFVSDWFFYLNVLLCLVSMLGLIFFL
jgi:hypothetical protein